ncbi:hypothetical protein, partial [Streptomyces mutabilis]|uniref:hypothetical protein n=1 Tax=Streptomyces mutabilis TaxID=67332 RepID=UPI0036A45384
MVMCPGWPGGVIACRRSLADEHGITRSVGPPEGTLPPAGACGGWKSPVEQVAVDLTAWVARMEPDPYLKQAYQFGVLED